MKITDLLKKVSLVAAVSAFALPAYASLSGDEFDIDDVLDGPKVAVIETVNTGPFTFCIVDTTNGEGLAEKTKRKITMTNGVVEQVTVTVDGFVGKHFFFLKGEGDAGSSNGRFNLGSVLFDLSTVIKGELSLTDGVEHQVTPFLKALADTKEHALEVAKEKALAKKEYAEEQEEIARELAEEKALAKKLAEEKALALKLKEEEEAQVLEEERLKLEALSLEAEKQKEVVIVEEEKKDDVVGDEL